MIPAGSAQNYFMRFTVMVIAVGQTQKPSEALGCSYTKLKQLRRKKDGNESTVVAPLSPVCVWLVMA